MTTEIMTHSIVFCVGYSRIDSNIHYRIDDCVNDQVFKHKSSAEAFLKRLRLDYDKNILIANLVYHDVKRFEENEGKALERGNRLPDYPTRIKDFRAARWEYHRLQFVDDVSLTALSNIYVVRELKMVN